MYMFSVLCILRFIYMILNASRPRTHLFFQRPDLFYLFVDCYIRASSLLFRLGSLELSSPPPDNSDSILTQDRILTSTLNLNYKEFLFLLVLMTYVFHLILSPQEVY